MSIRKWNLEMAVDQQMQLNHTLWSKYAASMLQDDEH